MKNKSITQNILSYIPVVRWPSRYKNFFRPGLTEAGIMPALFSHVTVGINSVISLTAASIAAFFLMRGAYYANKVWKVER
ncbi:MAG TPA: hypothetical protein VFW07_13940 [Parafilimonas sp.]|nr:hypothetical protein [Parafilimonas sp.]